MGSAIQKVTNACSGYNNAAKSSIVNGNAWATTIGMQNSTLGDYLKSLNGSQASMKGYIGYLVGAKLETLALQAGTVLLNAGLSFLATLLVNKVIGAWQKYKEGISSSADAAKQAATSFKETKNQLTDYAQAYQALGDNANWDTTSTEKAKQLQEQILELFKDQGGQMDDLLDKIDLQNGKYEEQKQLLNDIAIQNAKNARSDLVTNKTNAKKNLENTIGPLDNKGDFTELRGDSKKYAQALADAGIGSAYGNGRDYYLGDFDFSKAQDVLAAYQQINQAIEYLNNNFEDADFSQDELWNGLVSMKGTLEDNVNEYQAALDAMNQNDAIIKVGEALQNTTVDSKEAFDAFRENLVEGKSYSDDYKQAILDVADGAFPEYADAADNAADANANFGESTKEVNLDEVWSNLNSQIDEIQSAYSSLMSAMDEYNQYGALSMDTLQSLLTLDDQYLACLVDQNGQLSLNMQSFQNIATARLNDAKATAVEQAMEELHTIAQGNEITTAGGAATALSNKGAVIDTLAAQYKNLGDWAGYAAKAEALADMYGQAAAVDSKAANDVMSGLNAKFALIDSTMLQIQKSASGAGKALGGYGSAAKGAGGSAGKAASGVDQLTESLNKQKEAIEENKKALEKQQNKLKIYGQAAIDEIEKRIDELDKEKDAQDAAFDAEKKRLEEMKDAQDKLYDKQIDDLKDKKKALQDANDEEDRAIKLAQLQDALAKAQSQRTKRIYQHDTGFEWQVDESAVSEAQNNLDDQQRAWKREDAINAVEKEIDAIEKLKDAYDEEVEAAIDAIDKQKDAYDDAIDAEINKLNNMKDQWNETLSLIGTSWEDYQAKLAAAAEFNGMSLEQMYEAHTAYKDNVIANMQAIGEADAQLAEIENQLKEAEEAKNAATDAGTGSTGGAAGATNSYATAADALTAKLDGLALKIAETGEKNDELKQREAELCDQISNGNLTTSERIAAMDELHDVQSRIADNDQLLADLSAQYVEAIANETDVTVEYRQQQMDVLSQLADSYNINYGMVADTLNEYVSNLDTTVTTNEEQFGAIQDTIGIFADTANTDMQNAGTSMTQFQSTLTGAFETCGGSVDSLISKLNSLAETAAQTIQKVAEAKRQAGQGSSAIGSRSIQKTGYYHVDESGQEIVVHDGKPSSGRYTYLERGDQVLPASYSKNLWDMGSNPSEWFEKQYSKFSRLDTKAVYAGGTTVYSPAFTGDIVITNPVGNSDDLARGLKQNLPTSFMQAIGVRG